MTWHALRKLPLALAVLLAACAVNPTAKFLPATDPAWNAWLNKVVDIDLVNVPLAELPNRPLFQDVKLVFNGIDQEALVTVQAEQVTLRQALFLLADKYGLSMTLAPKEGKALTIVVGNREGRQFEMRPLK